MLKKSEGRPQDIRRTTHGQGPQRRPEIHKIPGRLLFMREEVSHMAKGAGWSQGSINIAIEGAEDLKDKLAKMNKQSETVVKRTVSDFKSRAPAWVSAAVTEYYAIKKSDVKGAMTGVKKGIGKIKVAGVTVDEISLVYSGRLLTPTHFKMKPTAPPAKRAKDTRLIPGQNVKSDAVGDVATVTPLAPYQVTAEIKKGHRVTFPGQTFLGTNKGAGYIPFQRQSEERTDIKSIKTVSIPQMITNEQVGEEIKKKIDEGLSKRLEHHLQQELAKG